MSDRLSSRLSYNSTIDPPEQFGPSSQTSGTESLSPSPSINDEKEHSPIAEAKSPVLLSEPPEIMKPASPQTPRSSNLRRSGTLSWQQRPLSRDFTSEKPSFPNFSRVGRVRNTSTTSSIDNKESGRNQFAPSLASSDRDAPQQRDTEGAESGLAMSDKNQPLPEATSRDSIISTTDPEKPIGQDGGADRSATPSRASSTFGDGSLDNHYSSISSASALGSPIPLSNAQKLEPRQSEPEDQHVASPTQRRFSPERSSQSTKGLGGFVQSAMMKRSDSVSKRWSAQVSPRHSRANSVAGNRNSAVLSSLGDAPSPATGRKPALDASPSIAPRPSSSHSEATVVHQRRGSEQPATPSLPESSNIILPLDISAATSRARSNSTLSKDEQNPESKPQTPTSAYSTRTMDPKRWSPTKSTWLESALNRPDAPRQKTPQQPPWARERQAKGSVDLGRSNSVKETAPMSPTRSPAPGNHTKKPSAPGNLDMVSSPEKSKAKEAGPAQGHNTKDNDSTSTMEKTTDALPDQAEKKPQEEPKTETPPDKTDENKRPAPSVAPKPNLTLSPLSTKDPISTRPKPQSPIVDFRSNLRRREVVKDDGPKEEPEFKNVFAKLRKAEASHYVPQDDFKENILKGKAALNTTGGPKKTPKVDEFKESILKQKEAMKTGGGSARRNINEEQDVPPSPSVPEAIARRGKLSKSGSVKSSQSGDGQSSPSPSSDLARTPNAELELKTSSPVGSEGIGSPASPAVTSPAVASPVVGEAVSGDTDSKVTDAVTSSEKVTESKGENDATEIQRGEEKDSEPTKTEAKETPRLAPISPLGIATHVAPAAATPSSPVTKGKLAGRVNPALAGLLSRGPPTSGANSTDSPAIRTSQGTSSISSQNSTESRPSPGLTHMTKSRARGPKRRLPKAATVEPKAPTQKSVSDLPSKRTTPPPETNKLRSSPAMNDSRNPSIVDTRPEPAKSEEPPYEKSKPEIATSEIATKPARLGINLHGLRNDTDNKTESVTTPKADSKDVPSPRSESQAAKEIRDVTLNKPRVGPKPTSPLSSSASSPKQGSPTSTDSEHGRQSGNATPVSNRGFDKPSPRQIAREIESKKSESPPTNKPDLPPKPAKSPSPLFLHPQTPRTPTPPSSSPLQMKLRDNKMDSPSSQSSSQTSVRGLGNGGQKDSSSLDKTLPSPPAGQKKPDISRSQSSTPPKPPPKASSLLAIPRSGEATELISGFFKTYPKSSLSVGIDPQSTLDNKTQDQKIRTLRRQIWEITGDGKMQDLPVNQEYILYEGSMYLCVHTFEGGAGVRTEAHLWCGDDVGEAALEDAQLFARKVSKENGCKLELTKQGKESARFIQALGGIIITRRGSSSRSGTSALYMLCGRRHLKQMAFDEVDFSRRSLCTGFPFVISARFGKLYLWKGKGSGAEEVGAARLIGMDLGLTGDFEEVTEGEEPEEFFENFPDYNDTEEYMKSDYWQLKPSHVHFHNRLLRLDHELGQRSGFWLRRSGSSSPVTRPNDTVQEIEPFCYKDVQPKDIYVLDTFFEIYV